LSGIADLRHRLTIERRISPAPGCDEGELWVGIALVWGSLRPLSGSEKVVSDRQQSSVTHEARFRHIRDMGAGMRIRLGARIFNIVSVIDEEERGRFLVCRVEERIS
jgi:SPP1 family predicted phage head-tail adaptor